MNFIGGFAKAGSIVLTWAAVALAAPELTKPADLAVDAQPAPVVPEAAEAPKLPELPAQPQLPPLELRVSNIQLNAYANFDEQGKLQNQNQNCYLGIRVRLPDDRPMLGIREVNAARMDTDLGQSVLSPQSRVNLGRNYNFRQNQNEWQHVSIPMQLPDAKARQLREVSGTITVQLGQLPVRVALLPAIKELDGRRARIEGLGGNPSVRVGAALTQRGNNVPPRVDLHLSQSDAILIEQIQFRRNGSNLSGTFEGTNGGNNSIQLMFRCPGADEQTQVEISFYDRIEEVEIPFVLRDVPLIRWGPEKEDPDDVLVKALPRGDAALPAGDKRPRLKVRID